jgi:transposase
MKKLNYLIKNMTQTEIARKLKVSKGTVTYWKKVGHIPFKHQEGVDKLLKKTKQGK